jgi:hypothetical protein
MRFTIPGRARPDKVASKDQTRPILTTLNLRLKRSGAKGTGKVTGGFVEATDSYKLVRLPVEFEEGDEPKAGLLPAEMFAGKRVDDIRLDDGQVVVSQGTETRTIPRPDNVGREFPDVDKLLEPVLAELGEFKVGLNAKYLYDLAQSMGTETVVLCFCAGKKGHEPNGLRPILVLPDASSAGTFTKDGPLGLLMPIRIRDITRGD